MEVRRNSPPIKASCNGSILTPRPLLVSGNLRARLSAMVERSALAEASVTPGRSRPTTTRGWAALAAGTTWNRYERPDARPHQLGLVRRNANDRERCPVEPDNASDHRGIGVEPRTPERFAQHGHLCLLTIVG